ncbi:MAG: hypothetical protein ACRD2L_10470 [Terriglobia bacterium]
MRRKRRTEFTIETERRLIVQRNRNCIRSWCDGCGRQVWLITPEEAAFRCGVSILTIFHRLEAQTIHFHETITGLWICPHSLLEL